MSADAESRRLAECRSHEKTPWKKWGPYLSERQWGTVREDYSENGDAWNYFTHDQARSRAYRWGEDGLAGYLRRQAAALFCAGAVERQGPDPQGAALRADEQRRQPRRGRQGVLLLPRQHADPLVHEVSLQVSAGGVSLRRSCRDQPPAQPQRVRIRTARHRRVRRRPLLRCVRGVRQGVARGHPDPDHGLQPRPGGGRVACAADPVVPQCLGPVDVARRGEKPLLKQIEGPAGASTIAATHPVLGAYDLYCEGERRCSSPRTQPTTPRLHLDYPNEPRTSRTASTTISSTASSDAVNPERHGHQGRGALPAADRPRPVGDSPAAPRRPQPNRAPQAGQRQGHPFRARLRRDLRRPAARGRCSSTHRSPPPRSHRTPPT